MKNRIDRTIIKNDNELFQEVFRKRNVKFIDHYSTPVMREITSEMSSKIEQISHVWSLGDRYYKLAYKYYGNVSWWWVIARFNNRPTESHNSIGDVIMIPVPLADVLSLVK
jgi:hypothetical protein